MREGERVFVIGASVTLPYRSHPDHLVTSTAEFNSIMSDPNGSFIGFLPDERRDPTMPNEGRLLGNFLPTQYVNPATTNESFKKLTPQNVWNPKRYRSVEEGFAVTTALNALNEAGVTPDKFREDLPWVPKHDHNTRPFRVAVGMTNSVGPLQLVNNVLHGLTAKNALETGRAGLSGHVNTTLAETIDSRGPGILNQAACSTTLYNLHNATRLLQNREADLAIVGGFEVAALPVWVYLLSMSGAMASYKEFSHDPTSASRPGNIKPAGLVFSEGASSIVLASEKSVSRLHIDNEQVLAEIVGVAIGQDSAARLVPPNPPRELPHVIEGAILDAQTTPTQIDVTIYHGTGTPSGDTHDGLSARKVWRLDEQSQSVDGYYQGVPSTTLPKSKTGHTMAASGGLSTITMMDILKTGIIPTTRNVTEPNGIIPNLVYKKEDQGGIRTQGVVSAVGMDGSVAAIVFRRVS